MYPYNLLSPVNQPFVSKILLNNGYIYNHYFCTDGRDYGNSTGSLIFTFNATQNNYVVCISIIKDDIFELTEVLEATLRLLEQQSSLVSVASSPPAITIFDEMVAKSNCSVTVIPSYCLFVF